MSICLKTAFRTLVKEKNYSLMNILGLVVGLSAFMLQMAYVIHESNYDRFHDKADRLYRIESHGDMRFQDNEGKVAFMPVPLKDILLREYPEVENVCRITNLGGVMITAQDRKGVHDWSVLTADTNLFQMFDFTFIEGNPQTALKEPKTAVITKKLSEKLFGNESPIGKTIWLNDDTVMHTITALIETPATNTHIQTSLLVDDSYFPTEPEDNHWLNNGYFTYVLLNEHATPEAFDAKMPALLEKYYYPDIQRVLGKPYTDFYNNGRKVQYKLIPVGKIHLHANANMDVSGKSGNNMVTNIFLYSALAILLLSSINYINISTARSTTRLKEIAVRKANGASKVNLMVQFMTESVLTVMAGVAGAAMLTNSLLPWFCELTMLEITIPFFAYEWTIPFLIIFGLTLGIVSGLYPAYVIANFDAIEGLKSKTKTSQSGTTLRKVLIVTQLSLSFIILLAAFVTNKQFSYMMDKDWGYDRENLMIIYEAYTLQEKQEQFKKDILASPYVESVTFSSALPFHSLQLNNRSIHGDTSKSQISTFISFCDYDYFKTLGLDIIQGRSFNQTDEKNYRCIINEAAAKEYGFGNDAVGKFINHPRACDTIPPLTVIGVVKDYNFASLKEPIKPMEFSVYPIKYRQYAMVRYSNGGAQSALNEIRKVWMDYSSNRDIHFGFLDGQIDWHYRNEISSKKALGYFSMVTLFIACLGLIGLVSYATIRRKKEIGIRKVNGASVVQIMALLSKDTVIFLGITMLIAVPASYFIASSWLENFAYRIELNPVIFIGTALTLSSIALITEILITQKAARQNPALALRDE